MNSNNLAATPVSGLVFATSPIAIVRRVSSIIIPALNGFVWRALSHIGKEVLKGINPSLTYKDSSPSVGFVCLVVWVVTSALHAGPAFVSPISQPSLGMAVFGVRLQEGFGFQAPTRSGLAVDQLRVSDNHPLSAVAEAEAHGHALPRRARNHWGIFKNEKSCELLTDEGECFRHSDVIQNIVVASCGLSADTEARCDSVFTSPLSQRL